MRRLFRLVLLLLVCSGGCAKDDYTKLYAASPRAPSLGEPAIKALSHLGATLIDRGVNFGVYSEHATKVQLALFDDPESDRPTRQFDMTRIGDVWNVYVEGVGVGQHYGFIAWGPNWDFDPAWFPGSIAGFKSDVDTQGNRFNPNKLLLDPYAKALHREHDWSKGSVASGPKRTESTYAAASKAIVVKSKYTWSAQELQWREQRKDRAMRGHRQQDLVAYEIHPKGFTADPASGVAHPGTFRGIGEKAAYLKELGINVVYLMPAFEKPLDGGYWGYQTLNFFIPEREYSFDKGAERQIDEFKWMVDQLHQQGLEVLLDVVYNHTGEGGLWREKIQFDDFRPDSDPSLVNFDPKEVAGLYSYRGIDNAAYYALNPQDKGFYWNNTGVGNETRCNHTPMRKLILDSLRYWVEEMHVDGFRFDLAPVLGEKDSDFSQDDPKNTVLQDIVDDPVLLTNNVRLVAEPWSLSAFWLGSFPKSSVRDDVGWGEWNGSFRDWWRTFLNGDSNGGVGQTDWKLSSILNGGDGGFFLYGSDRYFKWNGRKPFHSWNFVTVHDGFTMYDVVSYDSKVNGCGPLNPVCCDNPLSGFCDRDSGESHNRSKNWGQNAEAFKRQQMRNFYMAMMISHGTPLLLGGDEWMRTQLGNNNAYSSRADNPYNWYQWGTYLASDERHRMQDFVKNAIALRKAHVDQLSPSEYGAGSTFKWMNESGNEGPDWNSRHLAKYYPDTSGGRPLYVIVNMESGNVRFNLPSTWRWQRLVDTQAYFDQPDGLQTNGFSLRQTGNATLTDGAQVTGSYDAAPYSIVVLEAAP